MDTLKQQIIEQFAKEIDLLDLNEDIHLIELRYGTITENIFELIKKQKRNYTVPLHQTSHNNLCFNEMNVDAGKSDDIVLNDKYPNVMQTIQPQKTATTIPDNFSLSFEMKQYAKSKYIQNIEEVFENFKLYYKGKGVTNSDWEAVWKKWVLNQNRYANHLIKTTLDEKLELKDNFLKIAKKYIPQAMQEIEFTKFKNFYIARGDLSVSWERTWENWCINYKQFEQTQPKQQIQEKQQYKWDFKKAQDRSNKIKDWLRFEKGINWLKDHYQKNIPIPGIGWQKVMHPDFDKEEILLYKINSVDGQFMLKHKSDDIIEIEVLN